MDIYIYIYTSDFKCLLARMFFLCVCVEKMRLRVCMCVSLYECVCTSVCCLRLT